MTRWCVVLGWAAILVATAGCSARSPHGTTLRADRDLLTQEELREHRFSTVFEAIEALRAHWLRERGPDSFSAPGHVQVDRKSTRLNSSHGYISYAVFCLKKKKNTRTGCMTCTNKVCTKL